MQAANKLDSCVVAWRSAASCFEVTTTASIGWDCKSGGCGPPSACLAPPPRPLVSHGALTSSPALTLLVMLILRLVVLVLLLLLLLLLGGG